MGLFAGRKNMSSENTKFQFAIDRGGTFTDVFARCPGGKVRVMKLLSEDPQHYKDAPIEGIRRIIQEIWQSLYKPNETQKKEEYEKKNELVQLLCEKHIKHRLRLQEQKKCDNILTDSKITEEFVRSLPPREVLKIAKRTWLASDMKRFVIKPLQEQIEENQPLEYLTEMREVTIQFINIVPQNPRDVKLVAIINTSYQIVCKIANNLLGVVNKVSLFDKDVMILVIFGLRGIKHELESQNALMSGFRIIEDLSKLDGIKTVSVGVTNGLVYCGVVGHPLRKEFTVIGGPVNKAARIMCGYEQKVTCDHKTFKNSKLSSYYFQIQSDITLKGIEDVGHIYEYNEKFDEPLRSELYPLPIIGRKNELQLVKDVVQHTVEVYAGACFYGLQKTGKTKILKSAVIDCKHSGHTVASVSLTSACLRPYFCLSLLYKQLYNERGNLNSTNKDIIRNLPTDIWDFNEILQKSFLDRTPTKGKIETVFKKMCTNKKDTTTILCVDNIQFIDFKSLEIILTTLSESNVKLFCAAHFEEDTWDVQWKLSQSNLVKMINVSPMKIDHIPALCCQFLKTKGVSKKLVTLLGKTCEGRPGWIQSCLLRLVNNGCVEIKFVPWVAENTDMYVYPEKELLNTKNLNRKTNDEDNKSLLSVAHLDNKFNEYSEELSLAAISLDLFDSFPPYEQLVIKTGAVLGEFFSRSLLFVMLKYPNDQIFTYAIMNLFEEDVLDCGSRYVSTGTLFTKKLCCYCYLEESDFSQSQNRNGKLPRYAFCKFLHFKNKNLRTVAYELLPANQKKELHSRITDVLENQSNLCPNCARDDSSSIIYLNTFKQMTRYIREPYRKQNALVMTESIKIKDIIRESLQNKKHSLDSLNIRSSPKNVTFIRKNWDPTNCFCLEILTRVYSDLIYHSDQAGHLGKKIFYLIQYGIILSSLEEFEECIPVLTEASELCLIDAEKNDSIIQERFRKMHIGKIHTLLAEAQFRLGNIDTAKVHVSISLRQYNVPMLFLYYKIPHFLFLNRPNVLNKTHCHLFEQKPRNVSIDIDFGICMHLLSNIYVNEGNWEFAKRTALRSLYLLSTVNPNISLLCDVYSNAMELYNLHGDIHTCERIERCIGRDILRNYTVQNVLVELYAVCKLLSIMLRIRMFHGYIKIAIRLGYRAIDINQKVNAYFVQVEIIPIVATALLLTKNIDKAVSVITLIYNIGVTTEASALIDYYAFCIELNLETGFYLEPIEKCVEYIEKNVDLLNKPVYTDSENKIFVYLYLYYLRSMKWPDALKWKKLIKSEALENSTFIAISALFKYTESLLISFVWNLSSKKFVIDIEEKRIYSMLKKCQKISKKWKFFRPRYFHYMAYYKKIFNQKPRVKRYLKKAIKLSRKQNNILETCWMVQNQHAWCGGITLSHVIRPISWRLANTYDEKEWSGILYVLPHEVNE